MRVRYHGIAAAVAALLAVSGARAAAQLAPAATQGPARGLLRSEVSLMGHTLAISYAPDVTAGDAAANARAAPAAAAADRRTRVAEFSINGGTLRIGDIDLPKAEPPGRVYDVWLDDTDQGSTLRFVDRSILTRRRSRCRSIAARGQPRRQPLSPRWCRPPRTPDSWS